MEIWEPGVSFVAHCEIRKHAAPTKDCSCGIYAARDANEAAFYVRYDGDNPYTAIGRVSLWGLVIECERGWRASHAYPACIFLPAGTEGGKVGHNVADLADVLSVYGVPVLPFVWPWTWHASDWVQPVGPFPDAA